MALESHCIGTLGERKKESREERVIAFELAF